MRLVSINTLLPPWLQHRRGQEEGSEQGWSGIHFLNFILISASHCSRSTHGTDQLKQRAQRKQIPSQSNGSASSLGSLWLQKLWELWQWFFRNVFLQSQHWKKLILSFPQNLRWFQWSRFNKVLMDVLNFGLFYTLVKQAGREYFWSIEIKPFPTLLCRWLCLWAVWLARAWTQGKHRAFSAGASSWTTQG